MTFLRSLLFNLAFFGITFAMTLAGTVVRLFNRDRVIDVARLWARLVIASARLFCGIRLEVSGLENLPPGPALIASRHQSAFDTLVWLTLVPRCCYVLKRELLRIPLMGQLMLDAGMIAVDRSGGASALRSLVRAGEQAALDGRQMVIFPEGTRADPGPPLPLQPGVAALAARTNLPVVPAITDSGHYWGRRAFRKKPGTIRIILLPPIGPGLKREALMNRLRHDLSTPLEAAGGAGAASERIGQPTSLAEAARSPVDNYVDCAEANLPLHCKNALQYPAIIR